MFEGIQSFQAVTNSHVFTATYHFYELILSFFQQTTCAPRSGVRFKGGYAKHYISKLNVTAAIPVEGKVFYRGIYIGYDCTDRNISVEEIRLVMAMQRVTVSFPVLKGQG